MSNNLRKEVLLVGAGNMAIDYFKVLTDLNYEITVIGRGAKSAELFFEKTKARVIVGGLDNYLENTSVLPEYAIVAVGIENLQSICKKLINHRVKYILLEKPGAKTYQELKELADYTSIHGTKVFLAYNRRFYASVIRAMEIIQEDGGVTSFNFEFTEWSNTIEALPTDISIKNNWFFANSSHVVDMAFFMGGFPEKLCAFAEGGSSWHKNTIFAGVGITKNKALFSYSANWDSAGRWGVEILTTNHRLYFRPLEKLFIQKKNALALDEVSLTGSYDVDYKPGLYLQTKYFLENNTGNFADIAYQLHITENVYSIINPQA